MITADQVRVVLVGGGHRIDASVVERTNWVDDDTRIRLAAYALRDQFGWAVMRLRISGKFRTVARVDGLPESMARRVVAHRLVVLATA